MYLPGERENLMNDMFFQGGNFNKKTVTGCIPDERNSLSHAADLLKRMR